MCAKPLESGGDPRATSPKGAMGLMQLMPGTWATLRAQLGLGTDPYDVHDNILAGAAYPRALHDTFGAGGFLAAYNAGPGRYLAFVTRGRPLPQETRAYVAAIAPVLGASSEPGGFAVPLTEPPPIVPTPASVFVTLDAGFTRAPASRSGALFIPVSRK